MKQLRKLLFPFSAIYYCVIWVRNFLFDSGVWKSQEYDFPVISIGNLSTGGTGKTPMTEFLIRLLKDRYSLGVLSRGYGRSTTGYRVVSKKDDACEVGDEPLQYRLKFDSITVAVCEDRRTGIIHLRKEESKPEIIVLDDAYQHRKVKAGFSILLTSYGDLFYDDYVLPVGNLRESRRGANRAQVIIVTKCVKNISSQERNLIKSKLLRYTTGKVYFTTIVYDNTIYNDTQNKELSSLIGIQVTLVTGIANPQTLLEFLDSKKINYSHNRFRDHHNFTLSEIAALERCPFILTTEKDYMRLKSRIKHNSIFYLPIKVRFLETEESQAFEEDVLEYSRIN